MEVIWEHEPISAKEISLITTEQFGGSKKVFFATFADEKLSLDEGGHRQCSVL